MPDEPSIAGTLRQFNAKERYWVIQEALGPAKLSKDFCCKLSKALSGRIEPVDDEAWWAVDYHFDWLIAALHHHPITAGHLPEPVVNEVVNERRQVAGQQEDFDLVIATGHDVILAEAKAFTSWSSSQLEHKLARLRQLKADADGVVNGSIRLHFILMSFGEPDKVRLRGSEPWLFDENGNFRWLKMQPVKDVPLSVTRCDRQGRRSKVGDSWRLVPRPYRK